MGTRPVYRKDTSDDPGAAGVEAAGLRWLAEADGGTRVVRVLGEGEDWLELERIATARPGPPAARAFGRSLARTHAAGAASFGCAPPGWSGDGRIGNAHLPLHPPDPRDERTWGEHYATDRLLPYLRRAVARGSLDAGSAAVVDRVAARVAAGAFDADQPGLVTGRVARIHGDLWSGNVLWDADAGGEAVLIDPAAHGGHAETDLAMLALFGLPHLDEVLAGYEEVSPLADGWPERVGLHQLHPLLVHTVLFGSGYGSQTARVARQYA